MHASRKFDATSCTDEKTFSEQMLSPGTIEVCHPDVELQGKA